MSRSQKMCNISCFDQYPKNQHGWLVRVMRDGIMHQKFFSDGMYGGKSRSLREAKAHRDELVTLYPKPERGNLFNKMTARNTSGYPGVSKSGSYRKGHYYEAWQAHWTLPDGTRISKRFGFSQTGRSERAARRLAIKARREGLAAAEAMERARKEKREKSATTTRKATRKA